MVKKSSSFLQPLAASFQCFCLQNLVACESPVYGAFKVLAFCFFVMLFGMLYNLQTALSSSSDGGERSPEEGIPSEAESD